MTINVLVVNYDADALKLYGPLLAEQGISPHSASTMQKALDMLLTDEYSGVAINADDFEYLSLLKVMRALSSIPIGVSASHFNKEENAMAIQNGADVYRIRYDDIEYRVKGFSDFVKIHLGFDIRPKKSLSCITCGDIRICLDTREVFVRDQEVKLLRKEFDILCYLAINKCIVLTYEQIFRHVWGDGYEDSSKEILWNQICQLRSKLQINPEQPDYIKTVHGVGYCLDMRKDSR